MWDYIEVTRAPKMLFVTREYQQHLAALRDELAEAEEHNEVDRASRFRAEIEAVAHELGAAPRGRRVASHAERARLTVTKGIGSALAKIRESHPELGRHLAATVRRGYVRVYVPDPLGAVTDI